MFDIFYCGDLKQTNTVFEQYCVTRISQIFMHATISGFLVGTVQDLSDIRAALCVDFVILKQVGIRFSANPPELARKKLDHIFYEVITRSSYAGSWPITP